MPARWSLILSLLALAVAAAPAGAAGELDTTFGTGGKVTDELGLADNVPTDAVVQPDGKIVVVGNGTGNFEVTRLNGDGSVDTAFGDGGTSSHTFDSVGALTAGGDSGARAVALQPDGKIVVAGTVESKVVVGDDAYFTFGGMIRLNPDGSLDSSFSDDGKVFRGGQLSKSGPIVDVEITQNNRILVVRRDEVARYTPAGAVDTTFAGDGSVETAIGVRGFVVQPGGAIVVTGTDEDNDGDFAASRYSASGVLDTTFAGDGTQQIAFDRGGAPNAVALGAGGSIVIAGSQNSFSEGNYAIARLEADGDLDPTFSDDGVHVFEGPGGTFFEDVAVDAANRPVAVGVQGFGDSRFTDMTTVRLEADGDPDPTFDDDGLVVQAFGPDAVADRGTAVVLAGGKVLSVASTDATPGGAPASDYGVARYDATGALDHSLSDDGLQTVDVGHVHDAAQAAAVQPDGNIVVVGDAFFGTRRDGSSRFGVARYQPDGDPDPGFGDGGRLTTNFDLDDESAQDVVIQPDGKIVVVGWVGKLSFRRIAIARYNADGSLDTTFSNDGKQTTELDRPVLAEGRAVALSGDKIVVAGRARGGGEIQFLVARYNPDGALDETFSGDGVELTDVGPLSDSANDLTVLPGGAIVAVGYTNSGGSAALARYTNTGALDTSFGDEGKKVIELSGDDENEGLAAVAQAGGKIVAAGTGGGDFKVARLTAAGALDPTFSGDGVQTADFGSTDTATGLGIQSDGRILVGGYARVGNGDDFALARFTTTGTLDTSFGGDGKVTTDFAGRADGAFGMTMGAGDRVLLVGVAADPDTNEFDFAIARYLAAGGTPPGDDPPGDDPPGGDGPPAGPPGGPPAVLPPPNPPVGPGGDALAPTLSKLRFKPARFRTKKRGRKRVGTRLRFTLSEAATIDVELARCKNKRCKKSSPAGSIVLPGTAGTNRARFAGRVDRKALRRGRYRATAVARDAAGNASAPVIVRFRVVR